MRLKKPLVCSLSVGIVFLLIVLVKRWLGKNEFVNDGHAF